MFSPVGVEYNRSAIKSSEQLARSFHCSFKFVHTYIDIYTKVNIYNALPSVGDRFDVLFADPNTIYDEVGRVLGVRSNISIFLLRNHYILQVINNDRIGKIENGKNFTIKINSVK